MQILITGAAGLIGGELVAKLIGDQHGVVGLIRSNAEIRSNGGALMSTQPVKDKMPAPGQLMTIHGDIAEPACGLERKHHDILAGHIDLVIHCAAITAFDAKPEVHRAINIRGTENVRNMFPDARFLHVSTAYTCGAQNGPVAEALHASETIFLNGYEQSKAQAEAAVLSDHRKAVIARPSIVVGEHQSGQIKAFDTIYAVFRLIAEGRISAIPAGTQATLDFVPIDHVIGGLIDIINHWDDAEGKVFHLASGNPITPQMLVDAICSFEHLNKPQLVPADQFSLEDLEPRQQRLYKRTAAHYACYFDRNPRFVTDNLETLSGRSCPPIDIAALKRMINYCIEAGFLRAK